jgi:hypothetical protein
VQIPMLDRRGAADNAALAGIGMLIIVLTSLFLGGFVASRMTTRETRTEVVIYGALVWGAVAALSTLGLGAGLRTGLDAFNSQPSAGRSPALSLTDAVERPSGESIRAAGTTREVVESASAGIRSLSPRARAWWAFGALALSLAACVTGSLVGCGDQLPRRGPETGQPADVENRITRYERAEA